MKYLLGLIVVLALGIDVNVARQIKQPHTQPATAAHRYPAIQDPLVKATSAYCTRTTGDACLLEQQEAMGELRPLIESMRTLAYTSRGMRLANCIELHYYPAHKALNAVGVMRCWRK